jgi:hypothetical protein
MWPQTVIVTWVILIFEVVCAWQHAWMTLRVEIAHQRVMVIEKSIEKMHM